MIDTWCTALPALTRLELLGPFLVRPAAWKSFFAAHPALKGFLITQSPRFDLACLDSLVKHCAGLKELRLKEVGQLCDAFIEALMPLASGLTLLDLSDPTESLTDAPLIALFTRAGATLQTLDLSGNTALSDDFLTDGIRMHARALRRVRLAGVLELTDEGFSALFMPGWKNPALRALDLVRNPTLSGGALHGALAHSGAALRELAINGWKDVPEDALRAIAEKGKELRILDAGWCRTMDDFVVKAILEGCHLLQEMKLFGCNRVTSACPRRRGVVMRGVEAHSV